MWVCAVIFTVVFPTLRMGKMQANLAPVNEKYFIFNECYLEFCSYLTFLVLLHIFLTQKNTHHEFLASVSQMVVFLS